jgi:hypothetical protein
MPWMRLSVLLLMVSLIGLTNGCGNAGKKTAASDSETTSATPDGVEWEGQPDGNAGQGGRSTTVRKRRGNHPFDQIQAGETYESIVARFGQPHQQMMQYTWSTMSGTFHIIFDDHLNAINVQTDPGATPERQREVSDLVNQRVSLTSMSAHLGGDPKLEAGSAEWITADGHQVSIGFQQGRVVHLQHQRPSQP